MDWLNPNYDEVYEKRTEQLLKLRKDPNLLASIKQYYSENPDDFINDWMFTFDPRLADKGLKTTVPFILFERQREYINWCMDRWEGRQDGAVVKSRDMGISWLCCAFAVWMLIFRPGAVVGFGSRKEVYVDDIGNPASLFWKIRQAINLLPVEFQPAGWDEKKHAPFMRIQNPENGSVIIGEAGDNIGRGNRTSIYFVDESAFLERPDLADAALSQTSNCKLHVSTPNGAGNTFYRKVHSGKLPVFTFDWKSDPRKDDEWYRKQCETLDPVVVAQEIDRNFESSVTNNFIPPELVNAASARGPADVNAVGGLRVGIDVARFGDDKSVITFRRGRVLLKQVVLAKLDVAQVAARARAEIKAYGESPLQIAVDTIGIGAGVADMLRAWFPDKKHNGRTVRIVTDVNAAVRMTDGTWYNKRAYMWGEMREWLKTGSIPNDQDLKTDLSALRYLYRGGEVLLESKDDAKKRGVKSPDLGDSLALTFAEPIEEVTRKEKPLLQFNAYDPEMGY